MDNATLNWGIKTSFRNYISSGIASGSWTLSNVSYVNNQYGWSDGTGSINTNETRGLVRFPGNVSFTGHGGVLTLVLSNIALRLTNAESATIIADVHSSDMSGTPSDFRGISFATVALSGLTATGSALSTNGEAILVLYPTLVLTDTTIGPRDVQDQLRSSGVSVVFFDPKRSIDTIGPQITDVAHAVGLDALGTKLAKRTAAELSLAMKDIAEMAPSRTADRLRVAFLYVRGRSGIFFVFGKGMGAGDLITALGATDVATEAGITGAKPANSEALLAINPDVFLMMSDGLESTGGIEGLLQRPGVSDTRAGQHRRVVDMNDGQLLSYGPSTPAVLRSLAHALYQPGTPR